jgi:TadE-like protein
MKKPGNHRKNKERGSAIIEFALCVGLLWLPLFLGTLQIGFSLIRAIQVSQVCRDAGHMFAFGTDFSQTSNKYLLASFAPGLNVDPTGAGGKGVVILSTVTYVDDGPCPNGRQLDNQPCPNYHHTVLTRQIVIGNPALHRSAFATPASADSSGDVSYLTDTTAQVTGFSPAPSGACTPPSCLVPITSANQLTWLSEMFVQSSDLNWFTTGTRWVTAQFVF